MNIVTGLTKKMDSHLHTVIQNKIKNQLPSADFNLESDDSDEDEDEDSKAQSSCNSATKCHEEHQALLQDTTSLHAQSSQTEHLPCPENNSSGEVDDGESHNKEQTTGDDWENFRSSFDSLNLADVDFFDEWREKQIKAFRQELIASLMTMYHESQASLGDPEQPKPFTSSSIAAVGSSHLNSGHCGDSRKETLHNGQIDPSILPFDRLDLLESDIDQILRNKEQFAQLKAKYMATEGASLERMPPKVARSQDLMKQLLSKHLEEVQKFSVQVEPRKVTTKDVFTDDGVDEDLSGNSSTASARTTASLDLRPVGRDAKETTKPTTGVPAGVRIFMDRFGPSEQNSDPGVAEEEETGWQLVQARKTPKASFEGTNPDKPQSSQSSVDKHLQTDQPIKMPLPRKHKRKPKTSPQQDSMSDSGVENAATNQLDKNASSALKQSSKSKKKKRKKNSNSVSSDEGSQISDHTVTNDSPNMSPRSKSKKKKPENLVLKTRDSDLQTEKGQPGEISTNSDSDSHKSGRGSRLKSFTPEVMGPDDDPVFGLYSLTNAERKERIKVSLLRQIDSRRPLHSAPSTPTLIHQEETFGPPLVHCNPHNPPLAVLYIPLDSNGLVTLPTLSIPKDAHAGLHSCVVTWLLSGFATGSLNISTHEPERKQRQGNSISDWDAESLLIGGESVVETSVPAEPLLMCIHSVMQTVDHGRATIVCGVSGCNITDPGKFSSAVLKTLKSLTFAHLFSSLSLNGELEALCSLAPSENLQELSPFSGKVLLQSDCSIITKPVTFHWCSSPSLGKPTALHSLKPLQTTVVTLKPRTLTRALFVHTLFLRIHKEALDVSGMRTVYLSQSDEYMLALGLRGRAAIVKWLDIAGPSDPTLAEITDPDSLNAKFGSADSELFSCVSSPFYANATLAKWFGGRCNTEDRTIEGISDPLTKLERRKRQKVRFSDESYGESPLTPDADLAMPSPLHVLQVFPSQEVVLAVSPFVPSSLYSCVLKEVATAGYGITDLRRFRLSYKRAQTLGFPSSNIDQFAIHPNARNGSPASPMLSSTPHFSNGMPTLPTLLVTLQRENGERYSNCVAESIIATLRSSPHGSSLNLARNFQHCVHFCPNVGSVISTLGDTPLSPTKPLFSPIATLVQPMEPFSHSLDLVLVAVSSCVALHTLSHVLDVLLEKDVDNSNTLADSDSQPTSFELLGMKWIHAVSRYQAKLLMEYCTSDGMLTVDYLTNASVCVLACRAYQGHRKLEELKPLFGFSDDNSRVIDSLNEIKVFYSKSSQFAFSALCLFFTDSELFTDPSKNALLPYLPPPKSQLPCGILSDFSQSQPVLTGVLSVATSSFNLFLKIFYKMSHNGYSLVGAKRSQSANGSSSQSIVLAVQKENGLWCLEQDLRPFVKSSSTYSKALSWSSSFLDSTSDLNLHFPRGLCCEPQLLAGLTTDYKALCPSTVPARLEVKANGDAETTSSPLMETTCVVLTAVGLKNLSAIYDVISGLHSLQFKVEDLCLVSIRKKKSEELSLLMPKAKANSCIDSFQGSCLALILSRVNAASCFWSLVKSSTDKSFQEAVKYICAPDSEQQASRLVQLLCSELPSEE